MSNRLSAEYFVGFEVAIYGLFSSGLGLPELSRDLGIFHYQQYPQYDRVEYSAPIGSTIDREVFARKICQELGIEELTITQEYVLRGKQ